MIRRENVIICSPQVLHIAGRDSMELIASMCPEADDLKFLRMKEVHIKPPPPPANEEGAQSPPSPLPANEVHIKLPPCDSSPSP